VIGTISFLPFPRHVHESHGVRVPYEGFGWAGSQTHPAVNASYLGDHDLPPFIEMKLSFKKRTLIMISNGIIDSAGCMTPKYI